jgi:protein-tyrosine kinase
VNGVNMAAEQDSESKQQKEKEGAAMERITRAVERVRQERREEVPWAHSVAGASPAEEPRLRRVQISREKLRERRVLDGEGNDEFSQAYKALRTRIWHQMRTSSWATLAVTSANPGEGKTLTAINLAISLAMMEIGRAIILVDLDMRRPKVHSYFDIHPNPGISDYLAGAVPLEDVLVDPGVVERLVLLPGGRSLMNSSEILSSPRITRLLQELRSRYPSRLVICDLPPVLAADDALVLAPHMDAFLLVIEEGKSLKNDVSKAVELLKDTHLVGTVLNKSEEASRRYYGYGRGY